MAFLLLMFGWLFSDPLAVGTAAPDFTAVDQDGKSITLSKLRGKNVVLVFYPGDDTSVCTKQLCEIRDNWKAYQAKDVLVFGINGQKAESHTEFKKKYNFPFPLLVDAGQKVCELFHTNGLIVKRTVYLIGKDGTIRYGQRGKPSPNEVLAAAQ